MQTICLYQFLRENVSWYEQHIYNCKICKADEKNKDCKYYTPIHVGSFYVAAREKQSAEVQ